MADVSKINLPNNSVYNLKDSVARSNIGTLNSLTTTAKADLVSAINEINGTSGNAYTKAETDELLGSKADLVDGKVPASQLPSYVDDVLEYASTSAFPTTGESGKIYIATNTNKTYRWGGSAYVEISESLALGETASTAYAGNKGKANADAIAKKPGEITTGKQYTIDGRTVTAGTGAEAFNSLTNNKASGEYSHAEGYETTASGIAAHAEGTNTIASGGVSHAEGFGTTASRDYSHAEGFNTTASGESSHAEGTSTRASGQYSHAEGTSTRASGQYSHAEGFGTIAASTYQHVQGKFNVADSSDTYAFILGNGTADDARHNAFAIDWNGLIYVNGAATGVDVSAFPSPTDINAAITKANDAAPQSTTYTKAETGTLLAGKVDKEAGKGLSENDYTNADKAKLNGIETGAEANVQADWTQTDTTADDYIKNKPTITDVNDAVLTIQKNGTTVGTFSANAATAATINITVPAAQVNADWNAISGVAQILNKPAIYTTAQTDTLLDGKLDASAVSSTGTASTGWNNCRLSGGKIQYYNSHEVYSEATTSRAGLMSASDKQKLDSFGVAQVTVALADRTFTKSFSGLYYSDTVDLSGSFSEIYAATLKNFSAVENISIQPMITTNTSLALVVCHPSAPASLSFTGGSLTFTIFGRLK